MGLKDVGISYSSLVQEPVFSEDDKHLLRQLYQEVGIAIEHQNSITTTVSSQSAALPQAVSTDPQLRNLMSNTGIILSDPNFAYSAGGQKPQSSIEHPNSEMSRSVLGSQPLPGLSSSGKENAIPGLNQKSFSQTTSVVLQATQPSSDALAPLPEVATGQAQSTQHNDEPLSNEAKRQLFLARLKAAKSKKSGVSSGSPAPAQAPASATEIVPNTYKPMSATAFSASVSETTRPMSVHATAQLRAENQPPTATPTSLPRNQPSSVVRVNNAELHRRMESMREQAAALSAKSRPVIPSRSTSISSIDYSQSRDSDASESVQSVGDSSQATPHAMPVSINSGAAGSVASPQTQSRPSIPGLFMTESATETQSPVQPAVTSPYFTSSVTTSQLPVAPSLQPAPQSHPPSFHQASVQRSPARSSNAYANQGFQQQTNTLKRPASGSSGPIRFGAPKRPYGYRPYTSHDEQVVIDISSDEDEEGSDVMDLDEEEEAGSQFSRAPQQTTRHPLPQRPPAVANNLPNRPNFIGRPFLPSSSAPSSAFQTPPGAHTPNPLDIQRQHAAIEEERKKLQEQLNKRLQEKKKGRDGATTSPGQATPKLAANTPLPLTSIQAQSAGRAPRPDSSAELQHPSPSSVEVRPANSTPEGNNSPTMSFPGGATAAQTILAQSKPRSAMSVVASRNERIELLRKRQQELEEETRRQKQELEEEIRLLGVDTEGMTHEEMQVAKEDLLEFSGEASEQDYPDEGVIPSAAPSLPVVPDAPHVVKHISSDEEEGEIPESTLSVPLTTTVEPIDPLQLYKPNEDVVQEPQMMDPATSETSIPAAADVDPDVASSLEEDGELVDSNDGIDPDEIDEALNMVSSSSSGSDSDESEDYEPEITSIGQNTHVANEGSSSAEASSDSDSDAPLDMDLEDEDGATNTDSEGDSGGDSGSSSEESETYEPPFSPAVQADTDIDLGLSDTNEELEMSAVYDTAALPSTNAVEGHTRDTFSANFHTSLEDAVAQSPKSSSSLHEESYSTAAIATSVQPAADDPMDGTMALEDDMVIEPEIGLHSVEPQDSTHLDGDEYEPKDLDQMSLPEKTIPAVHEEAMHIDDNEDVTYEPQQTRSLDDVTMSEPDLSIQSGNGVPLQGMVSLIA
jgi:hypothetical protein